MNYQFYRIANLLWRMNENTCNSKAFENFKKNEELKWFTDIELIRQTDIRINREILDPSRDHTWEKRKENGYRLIVKTPKKEVVYGYMDVNSTWDIVKIIYDPEHLDEQYNVTDFLTAVLFNNQMVKNGGLVIHAAAVDWEGRGILFSGPSEVGKSTQAALWQNAHNVSIINGDRPALRFLDNSLIVSGTPWSGSSEAYVNKTVPVKAIVLLEQSKRNKIELLNHVDVLQRIIPRFFLPYFDQILMDQALITIERIISSVPIYLLQNCADEESVKLVEECLK